MGNTISKKRKKGFTLIELIVVIAILGILVTILILIASHFIKDTTASKDMANARNIFNSVSLLISLDKVDDDSDVTTDSLAEYINLSEYTKGVDWDVTLDIENGDVVCVATATFGTVTYFKSGTFS